MRGARAAVLAAAIAGAAIAGAQEPTATATASPPHPDPLPPQSGARGSEAGALPAQGGARGSEAGAAPSVVTTEDRERAARALERTLVERGGLLLEAGRFELVPQLSYAHADSRPALTAEGTVTPQDEIRRFTGSVTLRLGLPLRLQVEGEVPFVYAHLTSTAPAGGTRTATDQGLGDARVTVTLHLVESAGRFPDLLLTGFWKSRTGRSPIDPEPAAVPLGTGIQQVGGGLSLVKAVDPVVLLGGVTVGESVPRRLAAGWVDPGVEVAISTAAILAVSPETSLSFGLEQSYAQAVRLAGRAIPGSTQAAATFELGFATVASRAALFQVTLGIGLTEDVPRFQLAVATPLQF